VNELAGAAAVTEAIALDGAGPPHESEAPHQSKV
jgi:hypothetical protein